MAAFKLAQPEEGGKNKTHKPFDSSQSAAEAGETPDERLSSSACLSYLSLSKVKTVAVMLHS